MKEKQAKKSRAWALCAIFLVIVFTALSWSLAKGTGRYSWDSVYAAFGLRASSQAAQMPLSVHFLDVGQGDCIIVKCGDEVMLIDSGKQGNEQKIIRYMRNLNIKNIQYAVATHPDSDHIGSMEEIIETFDTDCFMMPDISGAQYAPTDLFISLLESVEQSEIKSVAAESGKSYMLGDAVFTFIAPIKQYDDVNNMSAVIKLTYGERTFLFMGDAEFEEESDIVQSVASLHCDVLKAGHHGSNSSSSEAFILAARPRYALISVGTPNDYGHPNKNVIKRFESEDCEVLRTDYCGTLVMGSDGENLLVDTEKSAR